MSMHKEDDKHEHTEPPPPSWEVLSLVGPYTKPETLAVASCISSTWSQCFSSEYLWKFMLNANYEPSDFAATTGDTMNNKLSYKRLVSTAASDAKRRRKNKPEEPKISLSDLVFIIDVSAGSTKATVVKHGKDLVFGSNERFQIEADVGDSRFTTDMKEVRMLWKVVFRDYQRMFTISDNVIKSLDTKIGWFTNELPAPPNRYLSGSNLLGDVKTSFNGEVLDKVVFAMAELGNWKSLFVDDVLRYLQCFLVD
ncbi:putative F-box protein [Cardamine amara subsp. amara]|uniref:F-box protein n=1 Tax=Cardamine amara subsp. amara TaxID=228776 RepID=A0ABD1A3S4_CARAN